MQRGFAFKLMAPKDIANVLALIGVHPAITPENIDKPTYETASSMFQNLAELAYDMDIQQVKARAPEVQSVGQYIEIFDEAMDVIAIFKLARQLAYINRVEDFSMKDIWDPQTKRLRALLSGMINFCRYKESQTNVITTMKQEVQALDNVRLELVDKTNAVGHELAEAQAQHSAELQDMWAAENELQEAQGMVDKLQKQKQTADRVFENAETKSEAAKERLKQNELRAEQLRETIASLQEEVAESPEGLESEIQELQLAIRQQKARVEEKSDEKRARTQRVQVLGRLQGNIDQYKESLEKVGHAAALKAAAGDRTRLSRNELATMRASLETRRGEELELGQTVQQVNADMDAAKQAHADNVQACEDRRQQAMLQHQELQEKRTEEQKAWSVLQAQRAELEAEIANVRRAHEAEVNDFNASLRALQEEGEDYVQTVEGLMTQCDGEAGRSVPIGCKPISMQSPGSARARRRSSELEKGAGFSCSPHVTASPAARRLMMGPGPSGY
jgi:predicted  nucleic acid-binding Zn-ribbon protein